MVNINNYHWPYPKDAPSSVVVHIEKDKAPLVSPFVPNELKWRKDGIPLTGSYRPDLYAEVFLVESEDRCWPVYGRFKLAKDGSEIWYANSDGVLVRINRPLAWMMCPPWPFFKNLPEEPEEDVKVKIEQLEAVW